MPHGVVSLGKVDGDHNARFAAIQAISCVVVNNVHFKNVVKTISETAERFLTCQTKVLGAVYEREKNSRLSTREFFLGKNSLAYKNLLRIVEKGSENFLTDWSLTLNQGS